MKTTRGAGGSKPSRSELLSSSFSSSSCYILGKRYDTREQVNLMKQHTKSLMKFSYRCRFPQMSPYDITDDTGWGCMIRVAQMMMAQVLQRHHLGEDWRVGDLQSCRNNEDYIDILTKFADYAVPQCAYSIHYMVHCGMLHDKLPGEWFGPGTAALALKDITELLYAKYEGPIQMVVTSLNAIYTSDIEKKMRTPRKAVNVESYINHMPCDESFGNATNSSEERSRKAHDDNSINHSVDSSSGSSSCSSSGGTSPGQQSSFFDPLLHVPPSSLEEEIPWQSALFLAIPLRLGVTGVSSEYIQELKAALQTPWCVGILGGKTHHAIYYVGYRTQENSLLGLDPHTTYPALSLALPFPSVEIYQQTHVENLQETKFTDLDPSLTLGFYCRNKEEFDSFCRHYTTPANFTSAHSSNVQLFSIEYAAPNISCMDVGNDSEEDELMKGHEEEDDEDFVFI